jgi:hypothetical protein
MTGEQLIEALQGEPLTLCQAGSKACRSAYQTRQKRRWKPPCGVDPTLQSVPQVKQGEQEQALGLTLHSRRLLTRAVEIALQRVRRAAQVVAEKPQFVERVLELSRLQPQFVLQDRHLAKQGGEVDHRRLALRLVAVRQPVGLALHCGALESGTEGFDQTRAFLGVEEPFSS